MAGGHPSRLGPLLGRSLLLLALIGLTLPLAARPTTAGEARQAVAHWLARDHHPLGAALGSIAGVEAYASATSATGKPSAPTYYVVTLAPDGFVIVAAEDQVEPIVGFSVHGRYDPSTQNPMGMLVGRDLSGRLRDARQQSPSPARQARFNAARRKWTDLLTAPTATGDVTLAGITTLSDVRVSPFVQSRWSQGTVAGLACYNYFTPPYGEGRADNYYCGCMATAMAQLMCVYKYPGPDLAVGAQPFTIYVDGEPQTRALRGGNGSGGPYDWTNMPLAPNSASTDLQRRAIGALTHDAGVATHMYYAATGSGAFMSDAALALTHTFGYAFARHGCNDGSGGINSALLTMINPNLDAGCPVILAVSQSNGPSGHAIICDGYGYNSSILYHHLNLGWGGYADAWYNLPTIDTNSVTYDVINECIYNVFPTGSGEIISGRVMNRNQTPLAGIAVTAKTVAGDVYTATSNANGIYALTRLPSNTAFTLSASRDGCSFPAQPVTTGQSEAIMGTTTGNRWGVDLAAQSPDEVPLAETFGLAEGACDSTGDAPWFGQTVTSHDGMSAAQSGVIGDNQTSTLRLPVTGPGTLSFWWAASSEPGKDALTLMQDGAPVDSISGEQAWSLRSIHVADGAHTIEWCYSKDAAGSAGADCGWVDQLLWVSNPSYTQVWVDFGYTGPETGTLDNPFHTLTEAAALVAPGGTITIKAGASAEAVRLTRAMRLTAMGGTVRLGAPLPAQTGTPATLSTIFAHNPTK